MFRVLTTNLPSIQAGAVTHVTLFGSPMGDNRVAHNNNSNKGWT